MKQKIVRRASALVLAGCLLAGAALPALAASAKEEVQPELHAVQRDGVHGKVGHIGGHGHVAVRTVLLPTWAVFSFAPRL